MTIKTALRVAQKLAAGDFGYGQDDRQSAWADNGKLGLAGLREPGDIDCSFSVALIWYLAGMIDRAILLGTIYTGNLAQVMARTGGYDLIDVRHLSLAQIRAKARKADALLGVGHVIWHLGADRWLSFEATEKGTSTGGKRGDQTGREGRIRGVYLRSASSRAVGESRTGWVVIIRPKSVASLTGSILDAYAAGDSTAAPLDRLSRRAPQDGRLWEAFVAAWRLLDAGMALTFDPAALAVPDPGHAFVVLGAGGAELRRRLVLAKAALDAHPGSRVLVTGGKPDKAGLTEAERGRDWLLAQGVPADRILIETKAASTIGNAKGSIPILRKAGVTAYTLVSDASHLRRGQVLFLAAQLAIECRENRTLGIFPVGALAFDDYSPAPVKTALPVTASTRRQIAAEVRSLLGL